VVHQELLERLVPQAQQDLRAFKAMLDQLDLRDQVVLLGQQDRLALKDQVVHQVQVVHLVKRIQEAHYQLG
jgi:hypothetical protein